MQTLIQFLSGKKTHLAAALILALLFGNWQGWWQVPTEVYEALMAAGLIFLRLGVAKITDQKEVVPVAPRPDSSQREEPHQ